MSRERTDNTNPLRCTFEDAERNHLLDGLHMSIEQKVAWFEEATLLMWELGGRKGVADEAAGYTDSRGSG